MELCWYQPHELRLVTRKAIQVWASMNLREVRNPVVIPVSEKSAIVEYAQDRATSQIFLFIPKGQSQLVLTSMEAIPDDKHRRMKSRVETAYREYRLSMLDTERVKLTAMQKTNDPE